MNERIKQLALEAGDYVNELLYTAPVRSKTPGKIWEDGHISWHTQFNQKFAELIVKEMCGMMEQAEDDAYHCFDPSERPTEYIEWLRNWQERFTKHFGVDE